MIYFNLLIRYLKTTIPFYTSGIFMTHFSRVLIMSLSLVITDNTVAADNPNIVYLLVDNWAGVTYTKQIK